MQYLLAQPCKRGFQLFFFVPRSVWPSAQSELGCLHLPVFLKLLCVFYLCALTAHGEVDREEVARDRRREAIDWKMSSFLGDIMRTCCLWLNLIVVGREIVVLGPRPNSILKAKFPSCILVNTIPLSSSNRDAVALTLFR